MFKYLNIKCVLLSLLIASLMYPQTLKLLATFIQDTFINLTISYSHSPSTPLMPDAIPVVFLFDSGLEVVATDVFELFDQYAYPATVGIIPSLVDESGYMNYKQIGTLAKKNWDFLNQSYSHLALTYDSPEKLLEDFNQAKTWMDARGLDASSHHLITPYGEVNPYLLPLLQQAGYSSLRTSDNIILLNTPQPTYLPIICINLSPELSSQEILTYLKTIQNQGKPILFTYHPQYPLSELENILQFLNQYDSTFQVVTYTSLSTLSQISLD